MRKKAALGPEMIGAIIITLFFLGVGGSLVAKIDDSTVKGYDKALCKQSVLLNSKARVPVINQQTSDLSCPTRYLTFTMSGYTEESRNFELKKKFKKRSDLRSDDQKKDYIDQANDIIAKKLFDCWDQFAAGQVQVLSAWDDSRQCVICTRFEFDEEIQDAFDHLNGQELQWTDYRDDENPEKDYTLDNFMRSHSPKLRDISYYVFVHDPLDTYSQPYYDYSFSEPYAIVFTAMNEKHVNDRFGDAWDYLKTNRLTIPATDFNVNPFYGEGNEARDTPDFINVMDLVRYSEVANICDTLE